MGQNCLCRGDGGIRYETVSILSFRPERPNGYEPRTTPTGCCTENGEEGNIPARVPMGCLGGDSLRDGFIPE